MKELLLALGIFIVTFLSRIFNLGAIPFFTDEAIYIRWAQIGLADPAHRFIALTDGKQPLLTWLMYPMLRIFPDPLIAGRMVSVISGAFACVGIYVVAKTLFSKRVGILSSLLYIISPFTLVYDRLALMDSLLGMFGIWSMYLTVQLVKKLRLDYSLLLGITAGLGALTKSSALFFIFNVPLALLLFPFKKKENAKSLVKFFALSLLSGILFQFIYNILRLSPWFYLIRQKNYSFILTANEFLKSPFSIFIPNLHGLIPWIAGYVTVPIALCIIIGIGLGVYKRERNILYLFLWFAIPFLFLSAFGRVIFPRFLLFMVYPLFVIGAYSLNYILKLLPDKKSIRLGFLALILFYAFIQSTLLIVDPIRADIPKNDRNQLMDDWPSGYGVKEVISYLSQKAKSGKIVVGTEGTFGLFPAVFEIYLKSNPNIEIYGYWPVSSVPEQLLESTKTYPTYLVFKEKQKIPQEWPITLIAKYPRGSGDTNLLFYQVNNRSQ